MGAFEQYEILKGQESDINEHLPVLYKYAKECDHVTEFGVRGIVSTWALLAPHPKRLVSYDIRHPRQFRGNLQAVYDNRGDTDYSFIIGNTLDVDIEPTDLLFIDTWHTYKQLKAELERHFSKVRKYILLHDTETFGTVGEDDGEGLSKAIEEFLSDNPDWKVKEKLSNNNGLTVIERREEDGYSVIIPTMWRSELIQKMLLKYDDCDLVKEVIIIDNDPGKTPDLSIYRKAIPYSKGTNIYVNPAWNWGVQLAGHKIILANDDILIEGLDLVLRSISESDFDIVGAGIRPDPHGLRIKEISTFPANSYGCFMYVRNYVSVPDQIKMWYGDDIQFYHSKKRGMLMNFGITTRKSTTIDSDKAYFRGVIGKNDIAEYKRLVSEGAIPRVI